VIGALNSGVMRMRHEFEEEMPARNNITVLPPNGFASCRKKENASLDEDYPSEALHLKPSDKVCTLFLYRRLMKFHYFSRILSVIHYI
jgi:hypothetical protein